MFYNRVTITGGNLNLIDADRKIFLDVKNFNFTVFKKTSPIPFLYAGNGIYLTYAMPRIYLSYPGLKSPRVFNSTAYRIHYFGRFIKYRKVTLGTSYFKSVSNGILDLKKKPAGGDLGKKPGKQGKSGSSPGPEISGFGGIIKTISDVTTVNINNLSGLSGDFTFLPTLKGGAAARITIDGPAGGKIKAGAVIKLKNVNFAGGDIKSGTIKCGGNFGKIKNAVLKFESIDLNMFGGNLKSSGSISIEDKEGQFISTLKGIDAGKLIDFYDAEKVPQFTAIAGGSVRTFLRLGKNFYVANMEKIRLDKPVEQVMYMSSGKTHVYRINYRHPIYITGETIVNGREVLLENTHVSSRILKGDAGGVINYAKSYLRIGFNASYAELPSLDLLEDYKSGYFEPSASGTVSGDIGGGFSNIAFNFKNRFKTLYINKYTGLYKGTADVDIKPDGTVVLKHVFLREKENGHAATGNLTLSARIFGNKANGKDYIYGKFDAKNIRVVSKGPSIPLSLTFNAAGYAGGELGNPTLRVSLDSSAAEIYGRKISAVRSVFFLTKDGIKLKRLEGIYAGTPFNVYGSVKFGGGSINNYDLRLVSSGIKLENLGLPKIYPVKGTGSVDLYLSGSFSMPRVNGSASLSGIYVNGYPAGDIKCTAKSSGKQIKIGVSAFGGRVKSAATVFLEKNYPYNVSTDLNLVSIDYRNTLFRLSGDVYASGKLSDIKKSYIFSKLDYLYLKHGPFFLANTRNIRISYVDGSLNLNGLELKGGNNYFQARGYITPEKYNIILNDRTDLWILRLFSGKILDSSGFMTASALIFGPPSSPKIYGYADINNGFIEPSAYPEFAASRIFAKVSLDNNVIVIRSAKFRLLHGIFNANGIIKLSRFKPSYYNLKTDFTSAVYRQSNYFYAKINGELGYSGPAGNTVLYGDVDVKRALYDKNTDISAFIMNFNKYNIAKPILKEGSFNPALNLRITSDKGILIKNNLADARFSADLNLAGTLYNPVLIGTAGAGSGKIYFRGTTFLLSFANLDFNNRYEINPYFNIAANTLISPYIIRMNASGTLMNFNVNLSSTPPLSELDIVSMLALGAPTTSVYARSAGGIAASQAASALGGGVEQGVTGTISNYFGFKNLSIVPSYSVVTHSTAPQVMVTKTISRRLSVSYSNIISSQSSQTATLTYKLSKHVSVIGEWDENELAPNNSNIYSEVGGVIVFHFRFY